MTYDSPFGQWMAVTFGNFDMAVFSGFAAVQNDIFTFLAKMFTSFGEFSFLIMLCLTCVVLATFKRTRKIAILIIFAFGVYVVFNDLLFKQILLRLRPYNALQWNSDYFNWYMNVGAIAESPYSFPSGHTCSSFAIATVLFFWIKNDMKKSECWMIFFIPVFVGLSRIYLMVHYPTDVIAGMIEGILIGISVWYAFKLLIKLYENYKKSKQGPKKRTVKFDAEPWLSKKLNRKLEPSNVSLVIVLILICFAVTTFTKINMELDNAEKCQHQGPDYICMNEATSSIKDPETGELKYYCELHN